MVVAARWRASLVRPGGVDVKTDGSDHDTSRAETPALSRCFVTIEDAMVATNIGVPHSARSLAVET
jgi:hypothetical protein